MDRIWGHLATLLGGAITAPATSGRLVWVPAQAAGRVTLDPDTGLDAREAEEIDLLLKARLAGEIDRPTFLAEIRRRGVLAAA